MEPRALEREVIEELEKIQVKIVVQIGVFFKSNLLYRVGVVSLEELADADHQVLELVCAQLGSICAIV